MISLGFASGYAPPSKRKAHSAIAAALEKIAEDNKNVQATLAAEMAAARQVGNSRVNCYAFECYYNSSLQAFSGFCICLFV